MKLYTMCPNILYTMLPVYTDHTVPCTGVAISAVGNGLRCKDHIVYKMFGDIVYTLHKNLTSIDSLGYDELFIYIYFSNGKVPVAYSNGLFI